MKWEDVIATRTRWSEVLAARAPPWWKKAALSTAAATTCLLLLQHARRRWQAVVRKALECKLAEAQGLVQTRLPVTAELPGLRTALAEAGGRAAQLSDSAGQLERVLTQAGDGLLAAFGDAEVSEANNGEDTDRSAVQEFLVAWREVGETSTSCGSELLQAGASLKEASEKAVAVGRQCLSEAEQIQQDLAQAEVERQRLEAHRGFLAGLFHRKSKLLPEDAGARREQLELNWGIAEASLCRLAKDLQAAKDSTSQAVIHGLEALRVPVRPVGEQLIRLRPGGEAAEQVEEKAAENATEKTARAPARSRPVTGQKVADLMSNMVTSEGRQKLREVEAAAEDAEDSRPQHVEILRKPPVESRGEEEWRICGVYTHQVLKAGLRQLDDAWPVDELFEFSRGGNLDAGRGLKMESLLRNLLAGSIRLQSVPAVDVSAAQYDLRRLSLRQLLRIRVHHLEFTPSGSGADSVSTVGAHHQGFMSTLDGTLFKLLGKYAVGDLAAATDDFHRLGREAVLLAAAQAGLSETPARRWCWCLDDSRRAYFDVAAYACTEHFPEEGVFEVVDLSKRDAHEPTGRLQWFDWRVQVIRDASLLTAKPLSQVVAEEPSAGAVEATDSAPVSPVRSAIAASAMGFDAAKLQDLRGNLKKVRLPEDERKVERPGCWP